MDYKHDIEQLESEWAEDDGFFWRIRQGQFVHDDFVRALAKVSKIASTEDAEIPKRLVSLLWYIPIFMHWQTERVQENGGNVTEFFQAATAMTNEVERVLGVP